MASSMFVFNDLSLLWEYGDNFLLNVCMGKIESLAPGRRCQIWVLYLKQQVSSWTTNLYIFLTNDSYDICSWIKNEVCDFQKGLISIRQGWMWIECQDRTYLLKFWRAPNSKFLHYFKIWVGKLPVQYDPLNKFKLSILS